MVKNADKLYYPIKEAIESILPICDEFIVALGDCDADDKTLEEIQKINSEKIKIINTVWDAEKFKRGTINAHQTNIAKNAASGDWVFYLQADEVIHEKYLQEIKNLCKTYLNYEEVDGFLFKYKHFYGDYNHYIDAHTWYKNEIRLVRNKPDIYSYASAQSFKRIKNFDGFSYRTKENTSSLNVIDTEVFVYHYGWVRPPKYMQSKKKALASVHHGKEQTENEYKNKPENFHYGDLSKLKKFTYTHPNVMNNWIKKFDWADQLNYGKKQKPQREKMKHEKLKYRIITWIENNFFRGKVQFGYSNWNILNPKKVVKK